MMAEQTCDLCKTKRQRLRLFKLPDGLYHHKRLKHGVIVEALLKEVREGFSKVSINTTRKEKAQSKEIEVKAVNPVLILSNKPKVTFEVPLCQFQGYEIGKEVQLFGKPVYQKKFRKLPAVYFYSEADNKEMEIIRIKRTGKDIDLEIPIPNHRSIVFKRKYYTKKGLYEKN